MVRLGVGSYPAANSPIELHAELSAALAEVEGLRIAMQSRAVIEQAQGMVMLREKCDAESAFQLLVAASQRSHRKLREVAAAVVATESGHAPPVEPVANQS